MFKNSINNEVNSLVRELGIAKTPFYNAEKNWYVLFGTKIEIKDMAEKLESCDKITDVIKIAEQSPLGRVAFRLK